MKRFVSILIYIRKNNSDTHTKMIKKKVINNINNITKTNNKKKTLSKYSTSNKDKHIEINGSK